ncbi:MAG: serine/threonine-protein phosphatase [Gammaproteobacteria bacterium]|nr:serine/threonine-protein phosphatase [Gammaproteobacteria bacterium]
MVTVKQVLDVTANPSLLHDATILANYDMNANALFVESSSGDIFAYTHRAPGKQAENEDSAGVLDFLDNSCVLAVADGMGGMPCGSEASKIAVESLRCSLDQSVPTGVGFREAILDSIEAANNKIAALGVGAGTTFAAVEIRHSVLRSYHIGDSVVLVVGQRGRIKLQTMSHSPVGYALEAGMLDENEAIRHDKRHFVSNILGNADMYVEIGSPVRLSRFDTVLVASDGLFDNLRVKEIVEIVRKGALSAVAQALIKKCSERMQQPEAGQPSKPDDIAFILFRRSH